MRWQEVGLATQRQRPNVSSAGYAYLIQAGFVVPVAAGIHDWGPLGHRVRERLLALIDAVVDETSGGRVLRLACAPVRPAGESPPIVDPKGETSPSAGWYTPALLNFAAAQPPVQPSTVREYATCNVVAREVERPRGLYRSRLFTLYEGLAIAADPAEASHARERWLRAWRRLFSMLGLPAVEAEAEDASGSLARGFFWRSDEGEAPLYHCPRCETWYARDVAPFRREPPPFEAPQPVAEVATPDCTTIEALCRFLHIPAWRAAKTMFLVAEGTGAHPVIVVVPGDRELSLAKVRRVVGPVRLRPARPEEIRALGAEPGYGSPVGVQGGLVIADITIANTPNLVAGANRPGYHLRHVNVGRDFYPHVIADVAAAKPEDRCPTCGTTYELHSGWKLGSVSYPFQRQSRTLTPTPEFAPGLEELAAPLPEPAARDVNGKGTSPWFVRAVLGLERVIAAVAETAHDDHGLMWPRELAPFDVHLVLILPRAEEEAMPVKQAGDQVYRWLTQAGLTVLMDDRRVGAGVKFADADLIGCPFRVTVSPRTLTQKAVEVKTRDGGAQLVPLEHVVEALL